MRVARISRGNLYADILEDTRGPGVWLYVVQRAGSVDVLALGSCATREAAEEVAQRIMTDWQDAATSASAS